MTEVQFIKISDIKIPDTRFRKHFSEKNLSDLQDSISNGPGLINAITLKGDLEINTGESRLKAITILHEIGIPVYYHGNIVPPGTVPALVVSNGLEELDFLKAEVHENTHREGFTYLEEAQAIARIAILQQALLNADKPDAIAPTSAELAAMPISAIGKEAVKKTAEQLYEGKAGGGYTQAVKDSLQVVHAMESSPELAAKLEKVKDQSEARKVLKNHAQDEQRKVLALEQGKTFSGKMHDVIHGDCLVELKKLPAKSFDVCCTDPIYGIDAGGFGNSGGRMSAFNHNYNDSLENFQRIMPQALKEVSRVLKDKAHIYLACDIRNLPLLRRYLEESSDRNNPWRIPSAPFIQYKLAGGRVPHPGYTPRRSYELWLYAYRGEKIEYRLINDVIECESDRTETHGAGKPKDLLKTFLNRSCMPGDKVIDFMAGSGSILPAAHELKLRCTAIELDTSYYGRCLERLQELK